VSLSPGTGNLLRIGMLTGLSYVSGIDYYRGINEKVAKLLPRGRHMERNADMVIVSLDCDTYVSYLVEKDHSSVCEYLLKGVQNLHAAGAQFLVIASNTAHICCDAVAESLPSLPILHIADCVATVAKGQGPVGLLGTEPTMRDGSWLKQRLRQHGIEVIVPALEKDRQTCYDIICQELSFDKLLPESRSFFVSLIRKLFCESGATGGVILGCTEIELLVKQDDVPEVPLYRSAELHIDAAAQVHSGRASLVDFLPKHGHE